jgi:hypothetical protein
MNVLAQQDESLFLSSKDASVLTGYTSDYISRLAREGKIVGKRIGISWFVEPSSLKDFIALSERTKEHRKQTLREERLKEREVLAGVGGIPPSPTVKVVDGLEEKNICSASTSAAAPTAPSFLHTHTDLTIEHDEPLHNPLFDHGRANAHTTASLTLAGGLATAGLIFALATTFSAPGRTSPDRVPFSQTSQSASVMSGLREVFASIFGFGSEVPTREDSDRSKLMLNSNAFALLHATATPEKRGVVVLPGGVDEATINAIRNSFSDDVIITLDHSGTTGTITPMFHNGAGESYRYVLVPMNHSP